MSESPTVFRFGGCRLDLAARELYREGKLVPLSPKVFDCLAWLFERRERAVGRDELSAAVWGRVDITDAQIDQLIRKVRRVVGDTGSVQEIIRTVPRFGYRWVAEAQPETAFAAELAEEPPRGFVATLGQVQPPMGRSEVQPAAPLVAERTAERSEAGSAATAAAIAPLAVVSSRQRSRGLLAVAGGAAVLLAIVVAAVLFVQLRGQASGSGRVDVSTAGSVVVEGRLPIESMAILPVAIDDEVDSEWGWLRLGLMDLITSRLREGGLTVVPTSNIVALIGNDETASLDPVKVQAATGARIVVSPSVRKTNGGWWLHLELQGAENVARELEVHAGDAVSSARDVADRLLVLLGHSPMPKDGAVEHPDEDVRIRRVDAAIDGGDYEVARQLLDSESPALRDNARVLLRRAYVERAAGHGIAARDLFQAVLDSDARTPLDVQTRSQVLVGLGVMLTQGGDTQAARLRLDEAIEFAQRNHLSLVYGDAMASRAALNAAEGREAEADSDFAQARIALELAGDTLGMAELEANQAATLIPRHRYADARALLDRAIDRMERFPPGETLITALGNKIFMHLALLEPGAALAVAEHAREQVARVENLRKRQAFTLHEVRALTANGRLAQARQRVDELAASVDPRQAPDLYASVLGNQAQLAFSNARWDDAAKLAARHLEALSVPALSAPLYARTRAAGWLVRVRALQRGGAIAEAGAEVQRFSAWAAGQQDPAVAVQMSLAQAEQAAMEHRQEAAIEAFETALASANRSAAPADIARVAVSYGTYLIEAGDLNGATRIVGQVARWSGQDFECAVLQVRLYRALGQRRAWEAALATARSLAGERAIPEALPVSASTESPSASRLQLPAPPSGTSSKN